MTEPYYWQPTQRVIVTTEPMGDEGEVREIDVTPLLLVLHGCGIDHDLWEEHSLDPSWDDMGKLFRVLYAMEFPLSERFIFLRGEKEYKKFRDLWAKYRDVKKVAEKLGVLHGTVKCWLEMYAAEDYAGNVVVAEWGA